MTLITWFAFLFASFVCIFSPGPTVMYIISQSLEYGKKSVLPAMFGVVIGDFVAMILSLAGLGLLMQTSPKMFAIFKLFCAGYLIYMGISAWIKSYKQTKVDVPSLVHTDKGLKDFFLGPFLVTAFNPKDIMFFVVFFPQFMDIDKPAAPQIAILMATFLGLVALNILTYGYFAAKLGLVINSPKSKSILGKVTGSVLILAGLMTLSLSIN